MHDFLFCFVFPVFCARMLPYVLLGGHLSAEEAVGPDWVVNPSHISQLKERYRRDRAKNKKGLAARKSSYF